MKGVNELDWKTLKRLTPTYDKGRQNSRVRTYALARSIFREFEEKIVEYALEGHRILFPGNIQIYIGVDHSMDNVPQLYKPYHNLHTAGKRYGLLIKGVDHTYHVKMAPEYRKELARRLYDGQEYPND